MNILSEIVVAQFLVRFVAPLQGFMKSRRETQGVALGWVVSGRWPVSIGAEIHGHEIT